LHQLKAVKSALATVERNITEAHLNHCVNSAVNSKNRSRTQEVMNEIKDLLKTIG
jgi:DNA-binding FrmR family transcriptional regulator